MASGGVLVGGTTGTLLFFITGLLLVLPAAYEKCCFTAVTGAVRPKITTGAVPNNANKKGLSTTGYDPRLGCSVLSLVYL